MAWMRTLTLGALGAGVIAGAVWALWPRPAAVDLADVTRGSLRVTVSAEGITRVREPYAITAPIAGILARSPVQIGDTVTEGQTVVALISPAEPALMDARSRAQAQAAVAEAEAAVTLADTNLRRSMTELGQAQTTLDRARALAGAGTISHRALEDAELSFTLATQALAAARSERDLRQAALDRARAQLLEPGDGAGASAPLRVLAPHSGVVLAVTDESARPVQAGAPLLSLGDLGDLDIETDLLSTDAVRVAPGASADIERWGGVGILHAVVRRIEPAAFTRVSALGIEEQRVRLRLDFVSAPADRPGLGDRYRVFVRITVWQGEGLVLVPQAALFRAQGGWAVFRATDGRAVLTPVDIGHQADGQAEVLSGLEPGARVVLYPPTTLADGAAVIARPD
ncbi:MAG: HlyD family efflux transporter periplasmic adaptor subunit [Rhodobacteraceae bacterium]|nr:HlyD family efflux transporter periplasmic adaptor subunit [Paracoccaceae bacterium]